MLFASRRVILGELGWWWQYLLALRSTSAASIADVRWPQKQVAEVLLTVCMVMTCPGSIYLLEEKESPCALKRIITFLSVLWLQLAAAFVHETASRDNSNQRKKILSTFWLVESTFVWLKAGWGCLQRCQCAQCLQMHPETAVFLTAATQYHYSRECSAVWCVCCLFWHSLCDPVRLKFA